MDDVLNARTEEAYEAPAEPDPFGVAHRITRGLRDCSEQVGVSADTVKYLWVHVNEGMAEDDAGPEAGPSLDHWLNVVDEAASLGVQWIVISMSTSLTAFPDIVKICEWAQESYGLTVGLHTDNPRLMVEELHLLASLDRSKTQVLAKRATVEALSPMQEAGFSVLVADPQDHGERPECEGPKQMIFVNPRGRVFTCGLVEDRPEYALGNIFDRQFKELLSDPSLPHRVHPHDHKVTEGCDGCPSLLTGYMECATAKKEEEA